MPKRDLRLLALDGGGVRGLSELMILEQLMVRVNPDAPPKPCEFFDMIGGTSTGGLIAIMLGRLKMSIGDCIDAYMKLSSRIFQKKRHRVTIKGKIQGRFDSDELELAVKEVIRDQGLSDDVLFKDAPGSTCKVFVCATSKATSETVCLTSYSSERGTTDLLNSVRIWEACRATSAASSFFDPIAIGRYNEQFVDGGLGANNPIAELWDQAQLLWGKETLEARVKCLVSIGTGIPSLRPFPDEILYIGEALVDIATETEKTAERFRRDKAGLDGDSRYFRFNVVRGLEELGLEEAKKADEIAAATRRYVASQEALKQMNACAENLRDQADDQTPDVPVPTAQMASFNPFLVPTPGLIDAAKDDDTDLVKELLDKGADVNVKDVSGMTAFWWAANKGYPEVLKLLLDTGKVKPDAKDAYGSTAFVWACRYGHQDCVKLLLETGKVDINLRDRDLRMTPLTHAARVGEEGIVELLLKTGKADLNSKDALNRTALMWATELKHEGVIKLIKEYSTAITSSNSA